jgi:class 3 adenylate cyclase
MAAADEIVRLSDEVGEREMSFHGRHFRLNSLLQLGDIEGVEAEIRACRRIAQELRQPLYLWRSTVFAATRALQRGDFDEGERLATEAWRLGRSSRQEITFVVFGTQIFIARYGQGRLDELTGGAAALAERYPESAWPAALAFMYAELDRRDEARAVLDSQARDGFRRLRRDGNWLAALPCLSVAVTYLDDKPAAAALYDLLAPYADRYPTFLAGAGIQPPNEAPLAWLAGTLERWDVAAQHFARALERLEQRGIGCFLPLVQRAYAQMLLAQGGEAQREQALALLAQALEVARAQKMKRMVEQLLELKLSAQGVDVGAIDVRSSIDAVARSVDAVRPDLRPAAAPDGTVTVMFSDIEGSTPLNERLGDRRFLDVLMDHHRILRRELAAHGGVEVRSEGDGFMIAFGSPGDALRCAVAVQQAFAAYSAQHPDHPLRLRIGLHAGEMLREKDELFGRNVVYAGRVADLARGEEILVSESLRRLVARDDELAFDEGRDVQLRGLAGSHRVYALLWAR